MNSIWMVFGLALLPAAGNFAEGLLAEFLKTDKQRLCGVLGARAKRVEWCSMTMLRLPYAPPVTNLLALPIVRDPADTEYRRGRAVRL